MDWANCLHFGIFHPWIHFWLDWDWSNPVTVLNPYSSQDFEDRASIFGDPRAITICSIPKKWIGPTVCILVFFILGSTSDWWCIHWTIGVFCSSWGTLRGYGCEIAAEMTQNSLKMNVFRYRSQITSETPQSVYSENTLADTISGISAQKTITGSIHASCRGVDGLYHRKSLCLSFWAQMKSPRTVFVEKSHVMGFKMPPFLHPNPQLETIYVNLEDSL